ncbi:MAG: hypothetical protein J6R29_00595, partial [Clostridia bacterium]|nr:hypothetical protein [Clostridia bacterium]
ESFTIKELEKQGIDVLKLLETLGVDLSKADSSDYEALKDISPFLLFSSDGLYEISFSTVFAFLPKGEDGTYPIFSQGARNMLRGYSLGYLMETDYETGQMRLFSELGSLKIGSLFPQTFTETYDGVKGEYIYTADNPAIEKLGNIKVSFITNKVSGEYVFDFGKELHEGDLTEFGDMKLVDLLADLIAGDDEDAKEETKNGLSLLGDVLFKDLFKYDEEAGMYAFDIEALLGELSIGKFMGYAKCTENESCPIHKDVANCDGEWYEKCSNNDSCPIHSDTGCVGKEQYQKYSGDTAEELITKNLIGLDIEAIMGGEFEISTFVEGVYLGHALGYTIASNASSEYCDKNCDLLEDHDHNYYWIDDGGDFVGNLYNDVSNMALINALNGEGIDLEGTVSYSSLGELLGKHKEGDDWYDEDGTPTSNETAMDKIMLSIYDKTMDEMSNGELELGDVLSGIKLGELMGHTLGNKDGYCEANCDNDSEKHKHKYYWLKDGNEVTFTKFDKTLYETNVEELVSGNKDFKAILSGLRVGELMGNSYENGVWYNENNEELELGVLDKTIYEVEVSKLLNNEVDFKETLQHLYVGQLMNYTGSKGAWEKDGKPVSKLNMVMADVQLAEIFDGTFDLKSKVNDLTLGDVLTIDEDTPTVLKILSTSKISKIS